MPSDSRYMTLLEVFTPVAAQQDPDLAGDALRYLNEDFARRGLPAFAPWEPLATGRGEPPELLEAALQRDREEALRWLWAEDIPLGGLAMEAFLRGVPGSASGVPRERLLLELRVRRVLAHIAGTVQAGRYSITAIPGNGSEEVPVDPRLLEHLSGSERSQDRIQRGSLEFTQLRLHEKLTYDPPQTPLSLSRESAPAETVTEHDSRHAELPRIPGKADVDDMPPAAALAAARRERAAPERDRVVACLRHNYKTKDTLRPVKLLVIMAECDARRTTASDAKKEALKLLPNNPPDADHT